MRRRSRGSRRPSAPTLSLYGTRDHIVEARFGRMLDAALKKRRRDVGAARAAMVGAFVRRRARTEWGDRLRCSYTERFIAWASRIAWSPDLTDSIELAASAQHHRAAVRPTESAALRHRTLSAAFAAESIDQILEHRPGIERQDPASGTTTTSAGDSAVSSTAIVAGLAAIDDASFFRPFASHPGTAAPTTVTAPISLADEARLCGFVRGQPLVQSLLELLLASPAGLQLLDRRRQLVGQHRQQPNASADGVLQARGTLGQRATAADELDAQSALEAFEPGDARSCRSRPSDCTCVPPQADRS